jgi:hypothetical protein
MKASIVIVAVLALTGCASVAPFGDGGAYVAKVATDTQNPTLVAESYCSKQGKVTYVENATPHQVVFTCKSAP